MAAQTDALSALVAALRAAHEVQWEPSPVSRGSAGDDQVVRVVFDERRLAVREAITYTEQVMRNAANALDWAVSRWEGTHTNGGPESIRSGVTAQEHEAHSETARGSNNAE